MTNRFDNMWFRRVLPTAVAIVAAVLAVLAVLQYRWTARLSDADEAQTWVQLESLMMDWDLDFYRELQDVTVALNGSFSSSGREVPELFSKYQRWRKDARQPALVQNVYLYESSHGEPRLRLLDTASHTIINQSPTPSLESLLARLSERSSNLDVALTAGQVADYQDDEGAPSGTLVQKDGRSDWQFEPKIPALVQPLAPHGTGKASRGEGSGPVRWIIVVLDMTVIESHLVPELNRRYFGQGKAAEYDVTLRREDPADDVIYFSDAQRGPNTSEADLRMNVFGPPPQSTEGYFWHAARETIASLRGKEQRFTSPVWFPVVRYSPTGGDWNLVVKRRGGSLRASLENARRRNLAVSFGVLLLLSASVAMLIISIRRAHRLAQLRMNFVASVSHELRTPVAVIRSAAENIEDQVVSGERLARYGSVIKDQSIQLGQLVEQVLQFASTQTGANQVVRTSVAPSVVIATVVKNTADLLRSSDISLEQNIPPDLPMVRCDRLAATQCLQNLVTNAAKYGGRRGWMGIRAVERNAAGRREVQITVEDRGPGIPEAELALIFRPFYRSPEVIERGVNGTGLGLALARSLADSMGGRISVASAVGLGSSFTLHLPVSTPDLQADAVASVSGVRSK